MRIGIIDSGIGGLTIYRVLKKNFPQVKFLYLADQKNCPYGLKTVKEIKKLAFLAIKFLNIKDCKIVIIACNTMTTAAIKKLREKFPQIKFIGVVPPVKPACKSTKTGHLVVISTKATQKSKLLLALIKSYGQKKLIYNLACQDLVTVIENQPININKVNKILKKYFKGILNDDKIDVLATGCTHFPWIKDQLITIFPQKIKFIEPSRAINKQLKRILKIKQLKSKLKKDVFYTTGNIKKFNQAFYHLLGYNIKAKKITYGN